MSRIGYRPVVFERAARLRASGGALILWCNALKALDRLGLRSSLLAAPSARVVESSEFRRPDGEFITGFSVAEIGRRHDAESIVVARQDLLVLLRRAAARCAPIRFGAEVVEFREEQGAVQIQLAD